ncbi:ParA family protein [Micromonospora sp. WMMA1363]|uniref:ParA family protein n=1 Tax=Micromonospora sp. WMMA1363 TaxID=3053985 RepID=UPI00259CC8FE|nr:ParA family protein [Micromonospora sp. WMMA1363]MDM4723463.1 ParA family protein [Micromonospora sp. WMMA1363]
MRGSRSRDEEFWENVLERLHAARRKLTRVVILLNGKGGTGKTTCTANFSAVLAQVATESGSAKRVLAMEFDPQGNLKSEFGQMGKPGDDDGKSILAAVMGTAPLAPMREVRPHLDLLPSGEQLRRVVRNLAPANEHERVELWLSFAEALAEIADEYEWILVDCPPGDEALQKLAMAVARWIVIPTVFDKASRYGLEQVGHLLQDPDVDRFNEDVDVLGVLMFAFERREARAIKDDTGEIVDQKEVGQRSRLRRALEEDLARGGSPAPVFQTVISNSRVVGETCRELGMVAYELADSVQSPQWPQLRKELAGTLGGLVSITDTTAEALAADYEQAVQEIFGRALKEEAVNS